MIRAVKGTRDILPPSSNTWNHVESVARRVFRAYNYQEIRTPVFEETQLFARGVGEDTDIVSKEMYTFDDHGTSLTLRPENTAPVIRAYIEHRLDQNPGLQKLYYIGPMFRRERPQKGRYRQFSQIGAEAIGSDSPATDAEVIEMVTEILTQSGLGGFRIFINSVGCPQCRPGFVANLKQQLEGVTGKLCQDCQRRAATNPLRVLDCKIPECQPVIESLPSILDHLCSVCQPHFGQVQALLSSRSIDYTVKPRLVRGLDYYMRTTFEFVHGALGAQNSVLGGGRYDGLAEQLGSKVHSPGIGFSIGEDRLVLSLEESAPGAHQHVLDLYIAPMGEAAVLHAAQVAYEIRKRGSCVELGAGGKLKRNLETANKLGARYVLLLGDNEISAGVYALKDMASGEQLNLTREQLLDKF
ncbi:MAG: histidine--tRNA ligase [Acidobacteria bacterium]|nr:histidine--tRNA ligase [Acidobacteriota bacterium]